jgi:DNA-binding transcriptional LysR family regulator
MKHDVEIRDLEALVAVAEAGSFTAAARVLCLTQPTVSARIAALESVLEARLLDRLPGGVRPTPAGEVLLDKARALLRNREKAVHAVHEFLGRPGGVLEVGASSIPGTYVLPPVLARLHRSHPSLRVRLTVTDTEKTVLALRRGECELAVVGNEVEDEALKARAIGSDEIVLVATPDLASRFGKHGRKAVDLLADLPLILREPGSGTRAAALAALDKEGVPAARLNIVLEIGGNAAAREAALQGIGAAFLSRLAVAAEIDSGKLAVLPLRGSPLRRPFVLLTPAGRTLSPGATALVRMLGDGTRKKAR